MTRKTAKRITLEQLNICKKPEVWAKIKGPMVMDPDGWRAQFGNLPPRSWEDEITYDEFRERAKHSTCYRPRATQ